MRSSTRTLPAVISLFWICLAMASCADRPSVDVSELLNYHTCTGLEPGAQWITWSEVSQARNLVYVDEPLSAPPGRFLAISNGEQPTGGYRFELISVNSDWFAPVLTFELKWHAPAAENLATTLVTSPCIIFHIDTQDPLHAVQVVLDGEPFAELAEQL